jgi:hypothetical protein
VYAVVVVVVLLVEVVVVSLVIGFVITLVADRPGRCRLPRRRR